MIKSSVRWHALKDTKWVVHFCQLCYMISGVQSFWSCSKRKKGYSGVCTWVTKNYSPTRAAMDILGDGTEDFNNEGRSVTEDWTADVKSVLGLS